MKLPHLPPVLFAKEVLSKSEKKAEVLCKFPCIPTLPMMLEAAAQSSGAFNEEKLKEGMLVGASDVYMYKKPTKNDLKICIENELSFGNMSIYLFEIEDFVKGKLTIHVQ